MLEQTVDSTNKYLYEPDMYASTIESIGSAPRFKELYNLIRCSSTFKRTIQCLIRITALEHGYPDAACPEMGNMLQTTHILERLIARINYEFELSQEQSRMYLALIKIIRIGIEREFKYFSLSSYEEQSLLRKEIMLEINGGDSTCQVINRCGHKNLVNP